MLNEEALKIVLNDKTFCKDEASSIVGGRTRLEKLVEDGHIRMRKIPEDRQNGRWYCNAWDTIKYACIK